MNMLSEEIAANNMDAEDEQLHAELGCRVTHELIHENYTWYGNPSPPEKTIRFRAQVAIAPICPRCHRRALGWLLQRADVCSPKTWTYCLREPENVRRSAA